MVSYKPVNSINLIDSMSFRCYIGTVRYPDSEKEVNFDRNEYNGCYNEVRFLKDYRGAPYITFRDFRELYNPWVFGLREQKNNPSAHPVQVNFKFRAIYDAVANNYQARAIVKNYSVFKVMERDNSI